MTFRDLFTPSDHLKWVQGVEANLQRQRLIGNTGGISLMILGAAIQILVMALESISIGEVFSSIINFVYYWWGLLTGSGIALEFEPVYEVIGLIILLFGIGLFFLSRHTKFLIKESGEPFRYTFWIDEFQPVLTKKQKSDSDKVDEEKIKKENTTDSFDNRSALLRHDLMERLNQRIGRFSLLDLTSISKGSSLEQTLSAHIHIDGHFAIREDKPNEWVIQVMPRVRIGAPENPSTLAFPVKFSLDPDNKTLTSDRYNQLVERVYSSIATEIYKQIEQDVKKKMDMFPTNYLRAVALSNEARDYMRSNTVDAYDHAIELYKEALNYFQVSDSRWKKFMLIPGLWRFRVRFLHARAQVEIGYAKCLIYRRQVSTLTGRYHNPLFEIPGNLSEVIEYLEILHNLMAPEKSAELTPKHSVSEENKNRHIENRLKSLHVYFDYPNDTRIRRLLLRPSKALFLKQTRIRFEAYLVISLAYFYLGADRSSKDFLLNAKSVHPELSESDALYLLTAANIEPDLDEKMILLRKTTEIDPDFEIAMFLLAQSAEMGFRREDEIESERAQRVIRKYKEVLKINPGNISALASLGYLYWLVNQNDESKVYLEEGCEAKAIVRQTFTGHLNYGLARIFAEQGNFQGCYDRYIDAISTDPGVGVYLDNTIAGFYPSTTANSSGSISQLSALSAQPNNTSYYEYIGAGMLKRFKNFVDTVEKKIHEERKKNTKKSSEYKQKGSTLNKTLNVVQGFVLNDYANACLNYYLADATRNRENLENAIKSYEKAIEVDPKNKTALFNLQQAYSHRGNTGDHEKGMDCLEKAKNMGPTWLPVLITSVESGFRQKIKLLNEKTRQVAEETIKLEQSIQVRNIKADETKPQKESKSDLDQKLSSQFQNYTRVNYPQIQNGKQDDSQIHSNLIKQLTEDIDELNKQIENVSEEFERILERTKLSFLSFHKEGEQITDLPDVDSSRKILDEIDLNALIIWQEILLLKEDVKNQNSAEILCHYLQQFYPEQFNYHYLRGNLYYNKGNYKRAAVCYRIASKTENDLNDEIFNMLGNACFGLHKYRGAIKYYTCAIELNDRIPIYYCNRGQAHGQLEDWNQMIIDCQKAVNLRKKTFWDSFGLDFYYEFLAEAIFQADKLNDKEHIFNNDDDLNEEQRARLNNRIGNLFFEKDDFLNAIPYYEKAILLKPNVPIYQCNLGRAYGNLIVPNWGKMIRHCKKAILLRKKYPEDNLGLTYYYEYLAEAYFQSGKLDSFLSDFESDTDLKETERASVYNKIGNLYRTNNQDLEAIPYFKKAVEADHRHPNYHSGLALTYTSLQMWKEAEESILQAINEDPNNAFYQNDLGNIYYRSHEYDKAAECYQNAIEIDPGIAVYHSNLGLALSELNKWDEAEQATLKATVLDEHNAEYQNDLGNIYFGKGEFDKAAERYSRALSLNPQEEVYRSNLALSKKHSPGTLQGD